MQTTKLFKVAAVSTNVNSFGLHGLILLAQDGEAFQVGANYLCALQRGDIVLLDVVNSNATQHIDRYRWATLSRTFEIPKHLPKAPPNVVNEVWNA